MSVWDGYSAILQDKSTSNDPIAELQGLTQKAQATAVAGIAIPTLLAGGVLATACRSKSEPASSTSEESSEDSLKATVQKFVRSPTKSLKKHTYRYVTLGLLLLLTILVVVWCLRKSIQAPKSRTRIIMSPKSRPKPLPKSGASALQFARRFRKKNNIKREKSERGPTFDL